MKLYVKNSRGQITYLSIIASTRADLAAHIRSSWFTLHGETFHVNNVRAVSDSSGTASGATIGGLVGLIGGPIGLLIGGVLGGALGNESDKSEEQKVKCFNDSYVN